MKLTKQMQESRNNTFKTCRLLTALTPIKDLVNFTSNNGAWINKAETLSALVTQIDRITEGQEYIVNWYTLDGDYLQVYLTCNNINYSLYCREILNTLENFLHVSCKIIKKTKNIPAITETTKSIICTKES